MLFSDSGGHSLLALDGTPSHARGGLLSLLRSTAPKQERAWNELVGFRYSREPCSGALAPENYFLLTLLGGLPRAVKLDGHEEVMFLL